MNEKGERIMFRSRNFEKASRKRAKANNRDWWKRCRAGQDPPISVVKVHWTPGSKLLKQYQETCRRTGVNIKFIEQSGHSLQNLLEKSNPFSDGGCGRDNCFQDSSVQTGNSRCIQCDKAGIGYAIRCLEPVCQEQDVCYHGETARSCFARGLEHLQNLKNKKKDSVLFKHSHNVHNGDPNVKYEMRALKSYGRDNLTRKTNEAVRINEHKGVKLNSRAEYRQPKIPRVVIENSSN